MQFAGQRTNENLEPIGKPDNVLVKLADDVIPEPDAVLVHGITPQKSLEEGLGEADFAEFFHEKVAQPDTVFVGFNNIRFDDEFMRMMNYRTFYDPYQWHWKDGRSRWDMMDPIRMMRALRPEGLKWPVVDGKPTVRLELMAKENGLTHDNAHDALSDVVALIELTQKFKTAQPKLFSYLLSVRDKKSVAKLVESGQPFVYTSGRYSNDNEKTSVVYSVFKHPRRESAIVYDLSHDPDEWSDKTPEELAHHWKPPYGEDVKRLPVKVLQYNRCPAIAPYGVLDDDSKKRIHLDDKAVAVNKKKLEDNVQLKEKLQKALDIIENEQQAKFDLGDAATVDDQLYSGFWTPADMSEMLKVRMSDPGDLGKLVESVKNKRTREMIPLYKARNYHDKLTPEERDAWEDYRKTALYAGGKSSRMAKFSERMQQLGSKQLNDHDEYLLTELQLYVESIIPDVEETDSP